MVSGTKPSGSSGPLVTSFERFAAYHAGESDLWERQALIRARVSYGSPQLAEGAGEIVAPAMTVMALPNRMVRLRA